MNNTEEKRETTSARPSGLQGKIFRYLIGFCVLLLIVLWLLQVVFLDPFYKMVKTHKVKRDAKHIAEEVDDQNLDQLLWTISNKGNVYVEVWLPDSQVFLSKGGHSEDNPDLTNQERADIFLEAMESGGSVTQYYTGSQQAHGRPQEYIQHAQVVATEGKRALILVATNLFPVESTVQTLRAQLTVVSIIMIILSIVLAWFLSRQVSRPIAQLNKSAKQLGQGDYSVNFHGKGYQEIEELSETLNQTTKELAKNEALQKELVANVSHDLRTPLTLITGYAEMMQDYPEECSPENLQIIVDESRRLSSLVNDLLDLSKLQAGMHKPKLEYFSITELTKEIIERYAKFREHDQYQIWFEGAGDVFVYADPARISQVIYNLIGNAINYTGEDKKVLVRQTTTEDRVWIEIVDTGTGLSPEALSQVWNRYYRATESHKRAVTGSGLGLSIVQTILEQHPGVEYGVQSEVGQGSSFWFSLPIAELVEAESSDEK